MVVEQGVTIERVLTDSGPGYKSHAWARLCRELRLAHTRIRLYRPQTNGKVERFNRTMLDQWAYVRPCRSDGDRQRRFHRWLHDYDHHRGHTALGGRSPIEVLNNLTGHYS